MKIIATLIIAALLIGWKTDHQDKKNRLADKDKRTAEMLAKQERKLTDEYTKEMDYREARSNRVIADLTAKNTALHAIVMDVNRQRIELQQARVKLATENK